MVKNKSAFSIANLIRKMGSSLFFLGYFPFGSGTIGSAAAIGGIWYLHSKWSEFFTPAYLQYYWVAIIIVTGISMVLSSRSKEVYGHDDPSQVIIDEVAGQFITFFMMPITIKTLIAGFVLFRFFDIVKPFPINDMQELEGGIGITMDDVIAGVFANISLLLVITAYQTLRSYL
jgi:phosphatidylglycerophosphatase A